MQYIQKPWTRILYTRPASVAVIVVVAMASHLRIWPVIPELLLFPQYFGAWRLDGARVLTNFVKQSANPQNPSHIQLLD